MKFYCFETQVVSISIAAGFIITYVGVIIIQPNWIIGHGLHVITCRPVVRDATMNN